MTAIEAYIQYLRYERNFSQHTEISYFSDLSQFEKFVVHKLGRFEVALITPKIIRSWVALLAQQKMSTQSIARKISALKSFFRYLEEQQLIPHNPTQEITSPKTSKPLPAFVNHSQIKSLLQEQWQQALLDNRYETFRDVLIIELMYLTGMRRGEVIALKTSDVDIHRKQILVNGKRNKQRLIPISDMMLEKINAYIDAKQKDVPLHSPALFVTSKGKPLYPSLLYRIVHQFLLNISNLTKASPHVLRHSFATNMLNNGADINAVKELLGHSSLASTEVYTHTSLEELKEIYKQAHPHS